jgi:hypothetical protein
MNPQPHPDATAAPPADAAAGLARSRADIAAWLDTLEPRDRGPGLRTAIPGGLPAHAARLALGLAARRHPWGLMAVAAAAGASLVAGRSWRWPLRPGPVLAMFAPLVSEGAGRWLRRAMESDLATPPAPPDPGRR